MIRSIDFLRRKVEPRLNSVFGSNVKILRVEAHGNDVKGLALFPGRIIRFEFETNSEILRTSDVLAIKPVPGSE